MKTRKLTTWVILIFVFILLMPLHEEFSVKNEAQASEHKPKVLLFIRKGICHDIELMLTQEVGVMTSMLEEAGFEVIVATALGEPIKTHTTELIPDLELADIKVNDYVGIIMPCMAKGDVWSGWHASPEEILFVKEAVAQGKPVAAQKGAIVILAEAGVLVGKKYTYYTEPSFLIESFAGAIYSGEGVIQDGNIITSSNCPYAAKYHGHDDGTSELTKIFIETIKD